MQETTDTGIRINKYIAEAGICSRREADRLIADGKVLIDGNVAETGTKVTAGMWVSVNGKEITNETEKVYLAFYKPRGIVCTAEKREKDNIIDFIHYPVRVTYCGRLDKDSEGLVILTNDGDIINKMMRAYNCHEKEYIVTVDKPVTEEFFKAMRSGVYLSELETVTRPCQAEKISETEFTIILTQGLNRQIRRMCGTLGYQVKRLKRVRVMNVELGTLKTGTYRELTKAEIEELKRLTKQSRSHAWTN